jgi:hypothetical protein
MRAAVTTYEIWRGHDQSMLREAVPVVGRRSHFADTAQDGRARHGRRRTA